MNPSLNDTEREVYRLVQEHFQDLQRCGNALAFLLLPWKKAAVNSRLDKIARLMPMPDRDSVLQALSAVALIGASKTSYEDVIAGVREGVEKGMSSHQGRVSKELIAAIRFSIIAATAFWDMRHPTAIIVMK